VVGQRVKVKVVKNKVAPPFRVAEFDMMHANGISYEGDVLDLAIAQKLIVRSGAWFRYGELQLGQGREKTRLYLKENPQFVAELREKIMADPTAVLVVEGEAGGKGDDAGDDSE
jgi:recombination protein RecA